MSNQTRRCRNIIITNNVGYNNNEGTKKKNNIHHVISEPWNY